MSIVHRHTLDESDGDTVIKNNSTTLEGANLLSDAIPYGGIQVPVDGQLIFLMADLQTMGGYTKIASVISLVLPKVAQLQPN